MHGTELGSNGRDLAAALDVRVTELCRPGGDDGSTWTALGRRPAVEPPPAADDPADDVTAVLMASQLELRADLAEVQLGMQLAVAQLVDGQAALQRQLAEYAESHAPNDVVQAMRCEVSDSLYSLHKTLSDLCRPLIAALDEVSADQEGSLAARVRVLESRVMAIDARTARGTD